MVSLKEIIARWHKKPTTMLSSQEPPLDGSPTAKDVSSQEQDKDIALPSPKKDAPISEAKTPNRWSLAAIFLALFFALTCIGLDRAIVATAIPQITTDFNSLQDVGWYGSAYLLTMCCFQLLIGKLYAELDVKTIFLASLFLFEVGSVICAVAPNSGALIGGRAVKGVGAAGMMSGAFIIIAHTVPMDRRPKYTGALGGTVGIAQSVAPTLGGVLTDRLSWRWCFWINLPFGGVTALIVIFLVHLPKNPDKPRTNVSQFLAKFDLLGTLLLIPWVVCLLFALQWGGTEYPWGSWRIILLLVLFAVLFVAWCASQVYQGDKATLPLRILKRRTMAGAAWYMFLDFAIFFLVIYYIPIWFQAVKGVSAYWSGINFLTTTAAAAVSVVAAGYLTSFIGYFVPQMIVGTIIMSVGCGMLYTFDRQTSDAFWIATLILIGFGVGSGIQQPVIAVQTIFTGADSALATSALVFSQSLSSTIFLCVGQNILSNSLVRNVQRLAPELEDPNIVVDIGAADVHDVIGDRFEESLDGVLEAYNGALREVFLICVVLSCLTILGVVGVEWVSVKKTKEAKAEEVANKETGRSSKGEENTNEKGSV